MRSRALAGPMLVVVLLTTACSDDAPDSGPATTDPTTVPSTTGGPTTSAPAEGTTTSQPPRTDSSNCPQRPGGNSAAVFDSAGGVYAAQRLMSVGDDQLEFDVVQWLTGDDADDAYLRESGDASGAPNDYFILNENDQLRTLPVADDAEILVLTEDGYADSLHPITLGSLPTDRPTRTFWVSIEDGTVVGICQQYRP